MKFISTLAAFVVSVVADIKVSYYASTSQSVVQERGNYIK